MAKAGALRCRCRCLVHNQIGARAVVGGFPERTLLFHSHAAFRSLVRAPQPVVTVEPFQEPAGAINVCCDGSLLQPGRMQFVLEATLAPPTRPPPSDA
jgi:hypothetical protein